MIQLLGASLVVVGLVAIIFGSRVIKSDGALLNFFAMPKPHAIAVKWAIGLLCIWFGAYICFTATLP